MSYRKDGSHPYTSTRRTGYYASTGVPYGSSALIYEDLVPAVKKGVETLVEGIRSIPEKIVEDSKKDLEQQNINILLTTARQGLPMERRKHAQDKLASLGINWQTGKRE